MAEAIHATSVAIAWSALAAVATAAAVVVVRRSRGAGLLGGPPGAARGPLLAIAGCATILGFTFLIAVVAPPDYVDAMTYHMGRVAHWIQNGSVAYYPTGIERQNLMMPFAEFVILHLQLLSGGDRWANLVQWTSFALAGLTVSLILDTLRKSGETQWIGAFVALSTPMAILQSTGAQNDLVVGLWLLAFLLYLWRSLTDGGRENAVFCGLALGLAMLTKGTTYLYAAAMGGTLLVIWLATRSRGHGPAVVAAPVAMLLIALSLNLGPWTRTLSAYGQPICCGEGYFVERVSASDVTANILRNVGLHMGVPWLTPPVERALHALSPAPLDDPATTFGDTRFDIAFSLDEGRAGNLLHLVAGLAVAAWILLRPGTHRRDAAIWLAVAAAGFLALAVPLKWQPWGSRLHTPAFLVLAIPVAIALGSARARIRTLALALFAASALLYVARNEHRPLVPLRTPSILVRDRTAQYFVARRREEQAYRDAAAFVVASREAEIGLLLNENDYEYPFWALVKEDFARPPRILHVGASDRFGEADRRAPPRIVVTTQPGDRRTIDGVDYVRVRDFGELIALRAVPGQDLGAPQ